MRNVHWDHTDHPRSVGHLETNWEKLYRAAVLEFDRSKLPKRIVDARAAILDRSALLGNLQPPDVRELDSISRALRILGLLQKQ